MHPIRRAVISIGSNLGERRDNLQGAVDALADTPEVWVTAVSPVYETEPVDAPEGSEDFLNAVVLLDTTLSARTLLERALAVESAYGRERGRAQRAAHARRRPDRGRRPPRRRRRPDAAAPAAAERAFVLVPWHDLEPDAEIPGVGPVAELLEKTGRDGVTPARGPRARRSSSTCESTPVSRDRDRPTTRTRSPSRRRGRSRPTGPGPLVVLGVVGLVLGWAVRADLRSAGVRRADRLLALDRRCCSSPPRSSAARRTSPGAPCSATAATCAHHQAVNRLVLGKACALAARLLSAATSATPWPSSGVGDPASATRLWRSCLAAARAPARDWSRPCSSSARVASLATPTSALTLATWQPHAPSQLRRRATQRPGHRRGRAALGGHRRRARVPADPVAAVARPRLGAALVLSWAALRIMWTEVLQSPARERRRPRCGGGRLPRPVHRARRRARRVHHRDDRAAGRGATSVMRELEGRGRTSEEPRAPRPRPKLVDRALHQLVRAEVPRRALERTPRGDAG